jgi:hypothetical protein
MRQAIRWKIIAFKWNSVVPCSHRLIFFNPYSSKFEEVPGGAPHGHGFTINEVFHRVHEGQDITELVEAYTRCSRKVRDLEQDSSKRSREIQGND